MKKWICALLLAGVVAAAQAGLKWQTELPAAQKSAKADHKLVLVNFTGSDWCPWCFKLRDEIFAQTEFADYAKKNLVLVEIDFPRKKTQADEVKSANKALSEKYNIEGFPTVLVLSPDGKEVGRLGYLPGGAKAFIAELDKIKK